MSTTLQRYVVHAHFSWIVSVFHGHGDLDLLAQLADVRRLQQCMIGNVLEAQLLVFGPTHHDDGCGRPNLFLRARLVGQTLERDWYFLSLILVGKAGRVVAALIVLFAASGVLRGCSFRRQRVR